MHQINNYFQLQIYTKCICSYFQYILGFRFHPDPLIHIRSLTQNTFGTCSTSPNPHFIHNINDYFHLQMDIWHLHSASLNTLKKSILIPIPDPKYPVGVISHQDIPNWPKQGYLMEKYNIPHIETVWSIKEKKNF